MKKENSYKLAAETIKLLKIKKEEKISKLIIDVNLEFDEYEKELSNIDRMYDVCDNKDIEKLIDEKYNCIIEKIRENL
jgi:hypothetical protein